MSIYSERRVVISGYGIVSAAGFGADAYASALKNAQTLIQSDSEHNTYGAFLHDRNFKEMIEKTGYQFPNGLREAFSVIRRMPDEIKAAVYVAAEAAVNVKPLADRSRIAVIGAGTNIFNGYTYQIHEKYRDKLSFVSPSYALNYLDTNLVGVISSLFEIKGEGMTVGSASASSMTALMTGFRMIRAGFADRCVIVAAPSVLGDTEIQSYLNLGAMRAYDETVPSYRAGSPFDKKSGGFIRGEGAACLILDAVCNDIPKNCIEILSCATALDGNHLSSPSLEGEENVMKKALKEAGLRPEEVDYINAHGTGTPLGDRTEAEAIRNVFGDTPIVNSDKGIIGHCLNSAGLCEIISAAIQMKEGFIHGSPNLIDPVLDGVHFVGRQTLHGNVRIVQKNAFAFGGINVSCVLKHEV